MNDIPVYIQRDVDRTCEKYMFLPDLSTLTVLESDGVTSAWLVRGTAKHSGVRFTMFVHSGRLCSLVSEKWERGFCKLFCKGGDVSE